MNANEIERAIELTARIQRRLIEANLTPAIYQVISVRDACIDAARINLEALALVMGLKIEEREDA